ncbi:MAG: hypothetical protein Q7R76_04835 [Candidatus Woesearchaeota archaeon]|nr:hypothetical protein [Candidatus Woesearchaeota archaeon]
MDTKNTQKIVHEFKKHMLTYILVLLALLFVVLFRKPLIVLGLIILGGLSTIYKRIVNVPIGFELITFFSLILTFTFSVWVGVISMVLMILISHITTGRICATMFGKMVVYGFLLVIALFFSSANIVWVGIGLSAVLYVILFFMYVFVFGYNPLSSFTSAVGGVIFNYIFFTKFAEILLKALL